MCDISKNNTDLSKACVISAKKNTDLSKACVISAKINTEESHKTDEYENKLGDVPAVTVCIVLF